jgi:hypothetical protein
MAKTQIKNYVFKPGIGANDNRFPNAYGLLSANKEFIQKEATSWIQTQVNAGAAGFVGYTYNQAKCERDVGYVVDAYLKDLRYGGNETVINNIKYYWDQDVAQVDGDRQPEIQTHTWIGNLIKDNIFAQVTYAATNTEVGQIISGTASEPLVQLTPTDATYKPETGVMTLTVGAHTMSVGEEIQIAPDAITFTCALDGNATLHPYPRASGVPNSTGKDGFYYAPVKIKAVTSTTITVNVGVSSDTSLHTFSSATANGVTSGPSAKINTLVFNTVDTITNGLTGLPKKIGLGVSTVKMQGNYSIDELLLVTNSTKSEVMYNFTNLGTGGSVEIITSSIAVDADFPKFLQTTDGITVLRLNYNSSTHSSTDDIQIFVEQIENGKSIVVTRPFDFGTDAIERGRTAEPKSMLDADFEYGLQPTKWAAIATMRGYPSVYEVPGTDASVVSVVSDASAGTEGVGQSLITVTTVSAHGYIVGTPITIKGLEDTVTGAARAEGSFVIVDVPTNNTFTFFAKSKVGTVNPTILSTTYTQLRQAGFYTGASIGTPNFVIQSNGSAGAMSAQLEVAAGSTIIPFDGQAPEVGSPLSNANIPLGSQVTGIIDQSEGGGTYVTPLTNSNTLVGQNQMEFQSISGVVDNLAIDRGDGTAIYINDITGNTVTFNDNFTSTIVGNRNQYTGIFAGNQQPSGQFAKFDISYADDSSGLYVIDRIANDGISYTVGDRIIISGTDLGGTTPTNDATITVNSVGSDNSIATASISGIHFINDIYLTGQTATYTGGVGTNASFDIDFENSVFNTVTVNSTNTGSGYTAGDVVSVIGSVLVPGHVGDLNDLYISVNTVEATGGQATTTALQVGGTGYATGETLNVATTGGNGNGLTFDITADAGNIITSIVINQPGTGYSQFDVVTITTGNSDATARIENVKAVGAINSLSFAGDAPSVDKTFTSTAYTTSSASGTGATIDIQVTGASYVATVTAGGLNYLPTETITVAGTAVGGLSPGNDVTITIDNVGGSGDITVITITGTAFNGDTLTTIPGSNIVPTGGTFNVSQNTDGNFGEVTIDIPGSGYNIGQTHTIPGTTFGGTSPTNDMVITILQIDNLSSGGIIEASAGGTGYIPLQIYNNSIGVNTVAIGTGLEFSLIRDNSSYSGFTVTTLGADYAVGDRVQVPGGSLDGQSPLNDIDISITAVDGSGGVQTFVPDFIEASAGTEANLISVVTMTEPTSGTIPLDEEITFSALATIEATFTNAHGLVPGSTFITTVSSSDATNNHNLASGSYIATDIPELNKLRFQVRAPGSINVDESTIVGQVFPRPDSFFVHRPFDGGVQLGTGGPQHGSQAIRQSKKYIRYQSGKGIMYTTGALFAPSYDLRSLTADGVEVGSLITIVTDDNDHGVQVGGIVRILGVETPGYNSGPETAVPPVFDYTVVTVIDERTYTVRAVRRLGATTAVLGFGSQMSVVAWHGATVRSGIFDDQNGIYWEFDGTNVSVNQRTGTRQLAGTIALQVDNNLITGTNTRFTDQLKAGDRIILKGMTHVVSHVNSQTEITVTPDWRGVVDIAGAKANLIVDKKVKQSEFNLDRLDGTGPSGYDIDIAKMQMIGIQYSWYGAGFIDFMLRGSNGNFVFAHRMRNSNVNTEAFMRSGNLPVRYEVTNEGPSGKLAAAMDLTQTTLTLQDGSFFPDYGTLYIDNEIMTFNGRSGNTITGLTRSAPFENFQAGATRSYLAGVAATHSDRTGVILISQTITPLISHWGSAFITDGGFDEDRGYIFSYAETGIPVSTTKQTAFMIRLSPSVSNALIGDLGERELLNRAQLLLQGLEITSDTGSTGGIVVEGVLNPQNYPLNPSDVGWSGLSGVAQGGQPSFAQVAGGGAIAWSTGEAATTTNVTTQAFPSGSISLQPYWWNGRYAETGRDYVLLRNDDYNTYISSGMAQGDTFAHPNFTTTTIRRFSGNFTRSGVSYRWMYLNRQPNSSTTTNSTATVSKTWKTSITSEIWFEQTSFSSSGATVGTDVSASNFPASTQVSYISLEQYFTTSYYVARFNNTSDGTTLTPGTSTIEFTFVQPPYAQPGETVFSFIATPGERSTLSLAELKELTNTPLGGRGTYPNGPDVLAINVYKVAGADSNANIILRWGEAQA